MTTLPVDADITPNYTPTEHADHHNALHAVNNILDAKGDIPVATASDTWSKLAVSDDGTVLTAASGEATGLVWAGPWVITANRQTASYTAVLADAGKIIEMNVATANDLTLPPDVYAVGDCGEVVQWGAGLTSIVAGAGVTIRSPGGKLDIGDQYGAVSWRLVASNEYHLEGNLIA